MDGAATLAEIDRWRRELVAGVLGPRYDAGVGDGGELVQLRYDTEAAARRDRDQPAGRLAVRVERHLAGPGRWYDCPVVHTMKAGDAGEAGFLRVVQGRLADPVWPPCGRGRAHPARPRPHVLGVTVAEHADGTGFTELTYLTRARDQAADRQMPVEMAVQLGTVRSYVEALEEVEHGRPLFTNRPVRSVEGAVRARKKAAPGPWP